MFLNPLLLAGLGGAVLPVVLHLLSRARYRSVRWGAMMFLADQAAHRQNASRLKQLFLLLLRMLLVACVAMALARPIVGGPALLGQTPPVSVVLIVDCSASTAWGGEGPAPIELGKRAALALLSSLRPSDRVAVLTPGRADAGAQPGDTLTADKVQVIGRVSQLSPGELAADLRGAVADARRLLDESGVLADEGRIYVVADQQARSWAEPDPGASPDTSGVTAARRVPTYLIPVGPAERENVAIESVRVRNPPVVRDVPAEVEVVVRNFGDTPRSDLPLTLTVRERTVLETSVHLPPRGTTTVRQPVRFAVPGSAVLTAQLRRTGLPADDVAETAADVVDPIGVLVIDSRAAAGRYQTPGEFVRLALSPWATSGRRGADVAAVKIAGESDWPATIDRSQYKVVVLADVGDIDAARARTLEQFVYGGGGLLIAPGPRTRLAQWTQFLWRDGAGLLPGRPGPDVAVADPSKPFRVAGLDLSHPMLQFAANKVDPLPAASVARYVPIAATAPTARVVATWSTGEPAILERGLGKGRVVLLTTTLDLSWGTLPLSSFYLPFVQGSVRFASAGTAGDRNLKPGDPIVASIEELRDPQAFIQLPDRTIERVNMIRSGRRGEARYDDTRRPGRYTLRVRGLGDLHYVVARPAGESDLTPLSEQGWEGLEKSLGAKRLNADDPGTIAASATPTGLQPRHDLSLAFLSLAVIVGCLELGLSRVWSTERGASPAAQTTARLMPKARAA